MGGARTGALKLRGDWEVFSSWKDGDPAGSFLSNTLLSHESADPVFAASFFFPPPRSVLEMHHC